MCLWMVWSCAVESGAFYCNLCYCFDFRCFSSVVMAFEPGFEVYAEYLMSPHNRFQMGAAIRRFSFKFMDLSSLFGKFTGAYT